MSYKAIVLERYPQAEASRETSFRWVVYSPVNRLGYGRTAAQAWRVAASKVVKEQPAQTKAESP